ncbi:alpha/beta hydrolase [Streptomyces sp. NPDC047108]|uniref:alpha/beta hydrolase n=1 Tax=Streptomyces sp. NPDC047108 TaxID=3155025 RepID=UPI0033C14B93
MPPTPHRSTADSDRLRQSRHPATASRPPRSRRGSSRRSVRAGALAAAGLVLGAGLTACDSGTDDTSYGRGQIEKEEGIVVSSDFTEQQPSWRPCPAASVLQGADAGKPKPLPDGSRWECADMKVPLDWSKQDGKKIDIALIRVKAKDTKRRLGSLVFNFGGPGGSGVTGLPGSAASDYATLHTRYDLVSFDPRGVGESQGVRCLDDKATEAADAIDATPDTPAEVRRSEAFGRRGNAACEKNSGAVLPHVDTESAARDMDLLRHVLGDKKLNYFGISYGTQLGGVYAHLFPERVGKAVFDAVVDPTSDPADNAVGQAKGFDLALTNFLTLCAERSGRKCPTGPDPEQGKERIVALLEKLDRRPLPTKDGRKVNESVAVSGMAQALYAKELWDPLARGLAEAMSAGSGDTLLKLSDLMADRDEQGRYSNANDANTAITCADQKQRYTVEDVQDRLPALRKISPVFGAFTGWQMLSCTDWPVDGTSDQTVAAPGSAPILVIGTTGDPATPYAGAKRMADRLGKGVAVNITNKGEGHGSYGVGTCVTKAVDAYLLNGKVPSDGLVCSS